MAIIEWSGAVSDVIDATGNWVGNAVPGATDDVVVPGTAARGMGSNMASLVDTSGSWYIHPNFKYNIGASGSPLQLSVADGFIDHSPANVFFKDDAGTTAYIEARKKGGVLHIDGDTVTDIYVIEGNVVIDAGIGAVASLTIGAGGKVSTASVASNAITSAHMFGGTFACGMALTTMYLAGGIFEMTSANKVLTTLRQTGGTTKLNTTGTLATAFLYGGVLDLTNDSQAKTVTLLWQWPGSQVTEIGEDDGGAKVLTNIVTRRLMTRGLIAMPV